MDKILPIMTTLISGLIIIIVISPDCLRELNPFTLFLLSVACALPVWALNQLLWWQLARKVSSELVGKVICVFDVSVKGKNMLALALTQLMKVIDIMRLIPSKNIANLVTIIAIYISVVVTYFTSGSPALLYGIVFFLCFIAWFIGLFVLHLASRKIDEKSLKFAWHQLKNNEEFMRHIDQKIEKIEQIVHSILSLHQNQNATEATGNPDEDSNRL